ncbi:MAG: lipoprotein-releasing system ATP-binding protein [Thermomicrobiales bacterium]|jgi:ABC-type lipoprotein export system ATPase subunit|nr:lipoprotein-releasing system ATP-binding protein [Thermomicrobiales bacterium]
MVEPLPLVVAEEAGRRFGTGAAATDALRSATCAIFPGERIALIGPSGSGKSTLLHLLGGLDTPSFGRVEWPALGPRDDLRPGKVADIFQGPSLLMPLSVVENVRLPLILMGMEGPEATSRAETVLGLFGVAHLRHKLPEEISGGQAQRVSIARALAVRPRLVLADEPTGQLDSATAARALDTLLQVLTDLGTAIVVSTHDPTVSGRFDAVWTMNDGVLATIAAPGHQPTQGTPDAQLGETRLPIPHDPIAVVIQQ